MLFAPMFGYKEVELTVELLESSVPVVELLDVPLVVLLELLSIESEDGLGINTKLPSGSLTPAPSMMKKKLL